MQLTSSSSSLVLTSCTAISAINVSTVVIKQMLSARLQRDNYDVISIPGWHHNIMEKRKETTNFYKIPGTYTKQESITGNSNPKLPSTGRNLKALLTLKLQLQFQDERKMRATITT